MKIVNSLKTAKKRERNCRIVRRRGRVYVINKKNPRFKARQGYVFAQFVFGTRSPVRSAGFVVFLIDFRAAFICRAASAQALPESENCSNRLRQDVSFSLFLFAVACGLMQGHDKRTFAAEGRKLTA